MQVIYFPIFSESIKEKYSKKALAQSNILSKLRIEKKDLKGRKFKEGITIDDIHSIDLDDGIWAYEHEYGYVVEVSIADVSELLKFNSPLDIEALERSTSVYYDTHANFMLPRDITVDKLSLNHNTTRLTLTVTINLDNDFNIIDSYIEETLFHNSNRFYYKTFNKSYNNKNCKFNSTLITIHKIATGLYSHRYKNIIIDDFKDDDRKLLLNDNFEDINDQVIDYKKIPSFCIQEFMILANKEVANFCLKNNIPVTYRNHMPEYIGNDDIPLQMDRAYYNEKMLGHYALGEVSYCHFTSPIRRYADLILHRQLKNYLRYIKNPSNCKKLFYSEENISSLSKYINKKVYSIVQLQANKEKEIFNKQSDRILKKATNKTDYQNIGKLNIVGFELLIEKLLLESYYVELPSPVLKILYNYLDKKQMFNDNTLILMFFTKNNIDKNLLLNYVYDKGSLYIEVIVKQYFRKGLFKFKQRNQSNKKRFHTFRRYNNANEIISATKPLRTKSKRPRTTIIIDLYYKNQFLLQQKTTGRNEKGAEQKSYTKLFRKIVSYYSKNNDEMIYLLLKVGYLYQTFLLFINQKLY